MREGTKVGFRIIILQDCLKIVAKFSHFFHTPLTHPNSMSSPFSGKSNFTTDMFNLELRAENCGIPNDSTKILTA